MTSAARLLAVALTAVALSMLATAATAQLQLTPQPQPQPPAAKKSDSGVKQRQDAKKSRAEKREERAAEIHQHAEIAESASQDRACATGRSQRRSRLRRLSARRLRRGVPHRLAARAGECRSEGDDAARRALRQRPGRQPRRQEGGRLVQAGRRSRRSRGDLRAGDVAHGRARRARQPRGGGEAPRLRRTPWQREGSLQSGAAEYRRPDFSAGSRNAPPNCSARRRMRETRKRNTRWRPSTRRAAASRRT